MASLLRLFGVLLFIILGLVPRVQAIGPLIIPSDPPAPADQPSLEPAVGGVLSAYRAHGPPADVGTYPDAGWPASEGPPRLLAPLEPGAIILFISNAEAGAGAHSGPFLVLVRTSTHSTWAVYKGEWRDQTGLSYLRNRYMDPTLGRFTQSDPAQAGSNWYGYAGGDPVNRTDPTGLDDIQVDEDGSVYDVPQVQQGNDWGYHHWSPWARNLPRVKIGSVSSQPDPANDAGLAYGMPFPNILGNSVTLSGPYGTGTVDLGALTSAAEATYTGGYRGTVNGPGDIDKNIKAFIAGAQNPSGAAGRPGSEVALGGVNGLLQASQSFGFLSGAGAEEGLYGDIPVPVSLPQLGLVPPDVNTHSGYYQGASVAGNIVGSLVLPGGAVRGASTELAWVDAWAQAQARILASNESRGLQFPGLFAASSGRTAPLTGTYRDLVDLGANDAHHIIQNAAVRDLPGYSKGDAPAIQLIGPSHDIGSPHYLATQVQRGARGGVRSYAEERFTAYIALRRAGIAESDARRIIEIQVDPYFQGLGVGPNTPLRPVGNRSP